MCWNGSLETQEKCEEGGLCFPFLQPGRDAGSPPRGLPRWRCEPPEPRGGSQEMKGFPVWSLLPLPTVVLAACRCSQPSDSSWRSRIGNSVVILVCCQCFAKERNQQKRKVISATHISAKAEQNLLDRIGVCVRLKGTLLVSQRHENFSHKRSPVSFLRENIQQLQSKSSCNHNRLHSLCRGNTAVEHKRYSSTRVTSLVLRWGVLTKANHRQLSKKLLVVKGLYYLFVYLLFCLFVCF